MMKAFINRWLQRSSCPSHQELTQACTTSSPSPRLAQCDTLDDPMTYERQPIFRFPTLSEALPTSRSRSPFMAPFFARSSVSQLASRKPTASATSPKLRKRSLPLLKSSSRSRPQTSTGVFSAPNISKAHLAGRSSESVALVEAAALPTVCDKMPVTEPRQSIDAHSPSSSDKASSFTARLRVRSAKRTSRTSRRPSTADAASQPPCWKDQADSGRAQTQAWSPILLTKHRMQKSPSSLRINAFVSKVDANTSTVAALLLPPPEGFAADAFEERVDLMKGLVSSTAHVRASSHDIASSGSATPKPSQVARAPSAETVFQRLEQLTERRLIEMLMAGSANMKQIEGLRLPLAFALARQQCRLDPARCCFKLTSHDDVTPVGRGLFYPGYGALDSVQSVKQNSAGSRTDTETASREVLAKHKEPRPDDDPLTPLSPPPRSKRRPGTAPEGSTRRTIVTPVCTPPRNGSRTIRNPSKATDVSSLSDEQASLPASCRNAIPVSMSLSTPNGQHDGDFFCKDGSATVEASLRANGLVSDICIGSIDTASHWKHQKTSADSISGSADAVSPSSQAVRGSEPPRPLPPRSPLRPQVRVSSLMSKTWQSPQSGRVSNTTIQHGVNQRGWDIHGSGSTGASYTLLESL